MNAADPSRRWALHHAWHSTSDRAALSLCAAEVAPAGVAFADAPSLAEADGLKLHGFELVEARREGLHSLVDLQDAARAGQWASRVDPRAWRYMADGDAVHGIPMALHQSNCVWANPGLAAAIERELSGDPEDLLGWLQRASRTVPHPLAIGREPWQVGILFETLSLALLGPALYRRAFDDLDPGVLGSREMTGVLEHLLALRGLVDDARLDVPWRQQLDDVAAGRAAALLTGDWVRASGKDVRRLEVQGVRDECVCIVDLFVPIGSPEVSQRVALALTSAGFQARFSAIKGSVPAVMDARTDPPHAGRVDAPSLTFDQCCGLRMKQALLVAVAEHFVERRSAAATAARLADIAAG
jgi:hypothetical protein